MIKEDKRTEQIKDLKNQLNNTISIKRTKQIELMIKRVTCIIKSLKEGINND